MPGATRTFIINPPGAQPVIEPAIQQFLGFTARSVVVDNYTETWLYFPDNGLYIAPQVVGAVRPLYRTQDYAYVNWANPLAEVTIFASSLEFASVMFCEDALPFQPGGVLDLNFTAGSTPSTLAIPVGAGYFTQQTVSVGVTATAIPNATLQAAVMIRNMDSTKSVYLGNATVTTANGMEVKPGEVFVAPAAGGRIWGVTTAGTAACRVLGLGWDI